MSCVGAQAGVRNRQRNDWRKTKHSASLSLTYTVLYLRIDAVMQLVTAALVWRGYGWMISPIFLPGNHAKLWDVLTLVILNSVVADIVVMIYQKASSAYMILDGFSDWRGLVHLMHQQDPLCCTDQVHHSGHSGTQSRLQKELWSHGLLFGFCYLSAASYGSCLNAQRNWNQRIGGVLTLYTTWVDLSSAKHESFK